VDKLDKKLNDLFSRRSFLAGAGGVAAATMVAGCSNNSLVPPPSTPTSSYTDADILNFALNLEYLEAQFYLYAATGSGLAASATAAPSGYTGSYMMGTVTKGNAAQIPGLPAAQQEIINEIAFEEESHVLFLRSALGAAAVPMPSIDLSFFGPLGTAANAATSPAGTIPASFSPFASFDAFLIGSFIFEDVGVTAYSGAAPLISAAGVAKGYLTAAAGILAVEAYHAAYVRTAITAGAIAAGSATAFPYITYANQVADLRAALTVGNSAAPSTSGSVETLLTLPTNLTTASSIVPASPTTAVGFSRNVNQVTHIVYGAPAGVVSKGGFFPSGMNSIFATTTA
jgi:hypothetical protein